MKRICLLSVAVVAAHILTGTGGSWASGLSVEPGGLLIQEVPVGEPRSILESSGVSFVVNNRDTIPHEYRISAHEPSRAGNGKWAKGYAEIPDPSWIRLVPEVLTIPAEASGSFDVTIDVPADERLYNQKWSVTLAVEGTPGEGRNIALALYPTVQIETQSRDVAEVKPLGAVAVAPGTLTANGSKEPLHFEIYNNDAQPHGYDISIGPPEGKIYPSPGLEPVFAPGLVLPRSESVWLEPGGVAEVLLDIDPAALSKEDKQPWEQLVFVESETGQCTFVRLQLAAR